MATVLGLVPPFVGPFIYMFFRPPEYLEDVRERELEIKAMEERLAQRDLHCPVCRAAVEAAFLVCPVCTTRLRQACVNCKRRSSRSGRSARTARRRSSRRRRSTARAARGPSAKRPPASEQLDSAAAWPSRRTLVLIKPDAMRRGLAGEILARFERRGLEFAGARLLTVAEELGRASTTPSTRRSRSSASSSSSSLGADAGARARGRVGDRGRPHDDGRDEPADAGARNDPRRPRASMPDNLVHGSDSTRVARREIALLFPDGLD